METKVKIYKPCENCMGDYCYKLNSPVAELNRSTHGKFSRECPKAYIKDAFALDMEEQDRRDREWDFPIESAKA